MGCRLQRARANHPVPSQSRLRRQPHLRSRPATDIPRYHPRQQSVARAPPETPHDDHWSANHSQLRLAGTSATRNPDRLAVHVLQPGASSCSQFRVATQPSRAKRVEPHGPCAMSVGSRCTRNCDHPLLSTSSSLLRRTARWPGSSTAGVAPDGTDAGACAFDHSRVPPGPIYKKKQSQ